MANFSLTGGVRHAILDLAPLELDCMNALWPLHEATVREIQQALVPMRPRAYTTIMTVLDRLAQKGIVTRRKKGRAWVYRPNLSAEEARAHAVDQVVEGFFEGSSDALAAHLSARPGSWTPAAGATVQQKPGPGPQSQSEQGGARSTDHPSAPGEEVASGLDATLL